MHAQGAGGGGDVAVVLGQHTLLSHSRYRLSRGVGIRYQNTSLRELPRGQLLFAAATLNWTAGLSRPGYRDPRIEQATRNLLDRIRRRGG